MHSCRTTAFNTFQLCYCFVSQPGQEHCSQPSQTDRNSAMSMNSPDESCASSAGGAARHLGATRCNLVARRSGATWESSSGLTAQGRHLHCNIWAAHQLHSPRSRCCRWHRWRGGWRAAHQPAPASLLPLELPVQLTATVPARNDEVCWLQA